MGQFNKQNVEKLSKAGIYAEENKDYTEKEIEEMNYHLTEFIYSHSTKNDDIPNLLAEYSKELNILQK